MFNSVGSRSATAYRKIGVETQVDQASPHELVEMLFEGLLVAIGRARSALQRGDISAKGHQIGIAVRILDEGLRGGLNIEKGGELAGNLHDLYQYCVMRLTQANLRNDEQLLAEVQKLIEPVATGWKQMGEAMTPHLQAA
ncbi:MAG: flagellar export chaperone FliS [Betaproteobacteria bacterium]